VLVAVADPTNVSDELRLAVGAPVRMRSSPESIEQEIDSQRPGVGPGRRARERALESEDTSKILDLTTTRRQSSSST
jgi:hypothetical protein